MSARCPRSGLLTPGLSPVPVKPHELSLSRLKPFEVTGTELEQSAPASCFATMMAVRVAVPPLVIRPPPRALQPVRAQLAVFPLTVLFVRVTGPLLGKRGPVPAARGW